MMPYSVVDSPYFKDVLEALDPRYKVPSRNQFSEVTIPSLYKSVQQKVKDSLKDAEQVIYNLNTYFISRQSGTSDEGQLNSRLCNRQYLLLVTYVAHIHGIQE